MANINQNISLNPGETRTITYKTGGTYVEDNMTFTITANQPTPTEHNFSSAGIIDTSYNTHIQLNFEQVPSGQRSYTFSDIPVDFSAKNIHLRFSYINDRTEHYFCFPVVNIHDLSGLVINGDMGGANVNIVLPKNLDQYSFVDGDYVEFSFIPLVPTKEQATVICTISDSMIMQPSRMLLNDEGEE